MARILCSALAGLLFVLYAHVAVVQAQRPYAPSPARQPARVYSNYIVVKGGIFDPQGDINGMDTGFNGELAYGYKFCRFAAFEIGSGYFNTSGTARRTFSGSPVSFHGDLYAIPLTITLKAILPLGRMFELYALGGGGVYYLHSHGTFTSPTGQVSRSDDSGVAGGFLGAGVTFDLTPRTFLGFEGKYLWTTSPDITVHVGATRYETNFKIQGLQGTMNLGFRF